MTWAATTDVSAPVELHDAVHRVLLERAGGAVDGRLVHVTWPTADGFRVIGVRGVPRAVRPLRPRGRRVGGR